MGVLRMPSLGADMAMGALVEWRVKPGDDVVKGDIVAVVETQKGAIEMETFETGRVHELLLSPGAKVPVGTPLAVIVGKGESASELRTRIASLPQSAPRAPPRASLIASPAARKLAAERGIDLSAVTGTGPDGAIQSADVLAAEPAADAGRRTVGLDLDEMRKVIAAAMARSKREIPHYYLQHTVDLDRTSEWLRRENETRAPEDRLLMAALLLKASALAVKKRPGFNGFFENGQYSQSEAAHAGMAISIRGGGLAAPAIHDVDELSLNVLMAKMRDLATRTRAGRLRSSELTDATLTVSSLGERGVESLYGVIYPPQVALIGFGAPTLRPWVENGRIAPRTTVSVTLSADHRASDGHAGALLLRDIDSLLQRPEAL